MKPFPEDHELISLFECEPEVLDDGNPWFYNRLTFETSRGPDLVRCEMEPASEEVRLLWSRDDIEIVNLRLYWVRRIQVEADRGVETFVCHFREDRVSSLRLQLKPSVHLTWGTEQAL